jgi:hypothetical protein
MRAVTEDLRHQPTQDASGPNFHKDPYTLRIEGFNRVHETDRFGDARREQRAYLLGVVGVRRRRAAAIGGPL